MKVACVGNVLKIGAEMNSETIENLKKEIDTTFADEIANHVYLNFISQINQSAQLFDNRKVQTFFATKVLVQFLGSIVWSMAEKGKEETTLREIIEMTKLSMKTAIRKER